MSDLDAIRAQRLAQLRAQQGGGGGSPGFQLPAGMTPQGGPGQAEEDPAAKAQAQQQEEEMRRTLMGQILESDARERRGSLLLLSAHCHAGVKLIFTWQRSVTYSFDKTIAGKTDRRVAGAHGKVRTTKRQGR